MQTSSKLSSLLENTCFNKLLGNSLEGILLLNKSFQVFYRSPNAERILGWDARDHGVVPMEELVDFESFNGFSLFLQDLLRFGGLTKSFVFPFKHCNGQSIWLEGSCQNMLEDPDIQSIVCHFKDITQKKISDRLLEEANSELYAYKYALDESAIVAVTDQSGIIQHVNDNFCRISGYTRSELVGQDHRIINSSFHSKEYIRGLWKTIANGQIWKGELKNKAKDGSYYWVDTTIVPFLDEGGKPYQYVAIRSDMTERKLTEERLDKEQRHLKLLESVITNTKDAILITEAEPQGEPGPRILYVNDAFTKMTGYTSEEVLGKNPRILQGPKTDREELKRLGESVRRWEACEITVINYRKNGEEFWINLTVTPVRNESGGYTHWISVDRDITESRKLEEEYNQIFNQAPDIICVIDQHGYLKKFNPAMSELLEYSPNELQESPFMKFIHPEDQAKVMTELQIKKDGGDTFYLETRCVTKTGRIKWLSWTSTPAMEDGLIFTVAKNITEKRELENLLDEVTRLAGIGGWVTDLAKGIVLWSDFMRDIYEVGPDFEPNMESVLHFYQNENDKKFITETINQAIETKSPFDIEIQILTQKNRLKWVRLIGKLDFENTQCVRIRGIVQDIQVRKKAELALLEALAEKTDILESIGDAFFAVDKDWIVTYWNSVAESALNVSKKQMEGHNLWDVFSDSIWSKSYEKYHEAVNTNQAVHFEDFYPHLERWYDISAYPSSDGLSVYFKDITESRKYVKAIEDQNHRFREIAYLQSHVVRAPLARIKGIVSMLQSWETFAEEREKLMEYLLFAANELDDVVNNIASKTWVGQTD